MGAGGGATRVSLAENDRDGRRVDFTDDVAVDLAALGLVEVRPERDGSWLLLPRTNRVGAVRVGAVDVVVHPKARFSSVLFMLGYARDPGFQSELIAGDASDDLWPLVAETLNRLVERALLRGVIQGYVTRDDALPLVRGRIRTADQMARHHGAPLPLEVTYDEYDADIAENRILRAALTRMQGVQRLPIVLRRRLGHLAARLTGARHLVPGAPLPPWRPSRLNAAYQPALRLSGLVLRDVGVGTGVGKQPVASFVVDMATVFEDFVTTAIRESLASLSPGGVTHGQYSDVLDIGARIPIRPDIVHTVRGEPVAVLDAKYKLATDAGGYPTADFYQMLAYCTALGLERGTLVYAGSREAGDMPTQPREHVVRRAGVVVQAWPLDVTAPPREVLAQVDRAARAAVRAGASTGRSFAREGVPAGERARL